MFGKTDVANPVVATADKKFLLFINCCLILKYKFNFEALKTLFGNKLSESYFNIEIMNCKFAS